MTEIIVGDEVYVNDVFLSGKPIPLNVVTIESGGGGTNATVYEQETPLATWSIPHSFNRPPAVSIIDTSGKLIYTDIDYSNGSAVVLTFNAPMTGKAILT